MPKTNVAVTIDTELVKRLDELIARERFPNRSQVIERALAEKLDRLMRTRLARECAKLDPDEERGMAEEGMGTDLEAWPAY